MRLTLVISTAPRAWATIRAAVWSMPIAGHGTFPSMGLRRLGFSDSRRGQSVADHPGNRVPHRRSDQSDGGAWRAVTLARAGYLLLAGRDTLFSRRSGFRVRRGCSSMVEQKPSKLMTRVRFPSPAPMKSGVLASGVAWEGRWEGHGKVGIAAGREARWCGLGAGLS
jgi:hypothetical protein